MEIKAPDNFASAPKPWLFLAGSIELGMAEQWQEKMVAYLAGWTVLNPRRADWDASWEQSLFCPKFVEQVEWELAGLEGADVVCFHFDPATKSLVTLFELGLFRQKAIVHCPTGFWRKGNVDVVCRRYSIPQVESLEELAFMAMKRLAVIVGYEL